jgi:hypothetical protein
MACVLFMDSLAHDSPESSLSYAGAL